MDPLHALAERKIQEAIDAGLRDDYAGKGEPLELEDLSGLPEDLPAAYILLKGSGHLPEEMEIRKEMLRLSDLVAACSDDPRCSEDPVKAELSERRSRLALRYALLMERRGIRSDAG
jgi:hypothetical protein